MLPCIPFLLLIIFVVQEGVDIAQEDSKMVVKRNDKKQTWKQGFACYKLITMKPC